MRACALAETQKDPDPLFTGGTVVILCSFAHELRDRGPLHVLFSLYMLELLDLVVDYYCHTPLAKSLNSERCMGRVP